MTKLWLAFATICIGNVGANVEVYNSDNVIETVIPDKPLEFGGVIPAAGLKGVAVPVEPITACQEVKSPPKYPKYKDFEMIALALKGNCTLVDKIKNIQAAGYDAAIIYNNLLNGSSAMENTSGMAAKTEADIKIPSVFIGGYWGLDLKNVYPYENGFYVIVNNTPDESLKEVVIV